MNIGIWLAALCGLFVAVLALAIYCVVSCRKMRNRMNRFMEGSDGESLEDAFAELFSGHNELVEQANRSTEDIAVIFDRLRSVYQKCGLVRYDAFSQMGGQMSFALVLLDEDNNGFILNSVHGSEGSYTYSKDVRGGQSSSLSEEEQEALNRALGVMQYD